MDGLLNEKASFHVEYIKGPNNIDEAAYEVIHFLETNRSTHRMGSEHRHKHSTRMVRPADDSDSESESNVAEEPVHSVRKLPDQPNQWHPKSKNLKCQSEGEHIDTMDHRMKCLEIIVQELKAEKNGNLQNTGCHTAVNRSGHKRAFATIATLQAIYPEIASNLIETELLATIIPTPATVIQPGHIPTGIPAATACHLATFKLNTDYAPGHATSVRKQANIITLMYQQNQVSGNYPKVGVCISKAGFMMNQLLLLQIPELHIPLYQRGFTNNYRISATSWSIFTNIC